MVKGERVWGCRVLGFQGSEFWVMGLFGSEGSPETGAVKIMSFRL